ncbi:MAG TPA: hypothetical protein VIM14_14655 [Polyangia bacterium]
MQRTLPFGSARSFGLMAGLFLFAACGMNAGGRCQIDSDCASGLICKVTTAGNGICEGTTAAPAGPDTGPGPEATTSAPDATVLADDAGVPDDGASIVDDGAVDASTLDDMAVDSGGVDSTSTEID